MVTVLDVSTTYTQGILHNNDHIHDYDSSSPFGICQKHKICVMRCGMDVKSYHCISGGELAQMVERSLSMREVRGSMPRFSKGGILKGTKYME